MKSLKLALVAAAAAAVLAPAQAEGLSYNIGVVSLYKFNGVDADSREAKSFRPAVQGGVDYDFGNGFYVGNWNSTGKFAEADLEVNFYGGYANELANGLRYDVGLIRVIYPDAKSTSYANYNEAMFSLGYGIATFKVVRGLTTDVNKKSEHYSLTLSQPINDKVTVNLVLADRNKVSGGHNNFSLGADYDLGDGMTATAVVAGAGKKDDGSKPDSHKTRLILGVSKSF